MTMTPEDPEHLITHLKAGMDFKHYGLVNTVCTRCNSQVFAVPFKTGGCTGILTDCKKCNNYYMDVIHEEKTEG